VTDGKSAVDLQEIERRLWDSADELRANSGLKESEYSVPACKTYLWRSMAQ